MANEFYLMYPNFLISDKSAPFFQTSGKNVKTLNNHDKKMRI